MCGPIVQRGRIEIGPIGPDQSMNLRVDSNLIENGQIPEGSKQLTRKHGMEIDQLFRAIVELHPQSIGGHVLERFDSINRMQHWSVRPFNQAGRSAPAIRRSEAAANRPKVRPDVVRPMLQPVGVVGGNEPAIKSIGSKLNTATSF